MGTFGQETITNRRRRVSGAEGCYLVSFRFLGPKLLWLSNDAGSLENTWLDGRRNNKPRNDDDGGGGGGAERD